jgi:hypothetical protein
MPIVYFTENIPYVPKFEFRTDKLCSDISCNHKTNNIAPNVVKYYYVVKSASK